MEQKIIRLYKNNSLTNISKETGLSIYRIKKILINNNIHIRTKTENILLTRGITNFDLFSKDNIHKMYVIDKLSVHKISSILNIHYRNVYSWLKKYDIPVISSKSLEKIYYVYVLCDPLIGGIWNINGFRFYDIPFYIGYGKSDRCFYHMTEHSLKQYNKSKNDKILDILSVGRYPIIHKIKINLCLKEAILLESEMIKYAFHNKIPITNKSNGGEIGGRYVKIVAKYKPDFLNFNHKLMVVYDSINDATIKNKLSKINFDGISGGHIYQKFIKKENVNNILYRKLSKHSVLVYGDISHYDNPVCVYDNDGNFIGLYKQNIVIDTLKFRMPNNLYLYKHPNGYYCIRKNDIKWDHETNIFKHTIYKNGKLTIPIS